MRECIYRCNGKRGMKPNYWFGKIRDITESRDHTEMQVDARGSYFHIVLGKHRYGNYICVPNWGIGTELAEYTNREWNYHQMVTTYPRISKVDLISIADAIYSYGLSKELTPF